MALLDIGYNLAMQLEINGDGDLDRAGKEVIAMHPHSGLDLRLARLAYSFLIINERKDRPISDIEEF
ncbi:hypothetical protein [Zymobacter sp. IVIA_12111.31 C1]|uniref:hypothetical protein n=1 Tax=Zymobacter sp. IVIA_12111.31 C1 TaxID=3394854 RepID=UPI0039C14479